MSLRVYLERSAGRTHKFWEVLVQGRLVRVRWGRIGAAHPGEHQVLAESQAHAAELARARLARKLRRGYRRTTPGDRPPRPVSPAPDARQLSLSLPPPLPPVPPLPRRFHWRSSCPT